MNNEEQKVVMELMARVSAIESVIGSQKSPEEEGLRERLQRQREERVDANREKRKEEAAKRPKESRPLGQHKREEVARRSNNVLPGPVTNQRQKGSDPKTGEPIDFYVYYDNEYGTMSILTNGFSPL